MLGFCVGDYEYYTCTPGVPFFTDRFQISVKKRAPCQKKAPREKKGIFGTKFPIFFKKKAHCQKKGSVSKKKGIKKAHRVCII